MTYAVRARHRHWLGVGPGGAAHHLTGDRLGQRVVQDIEVGDPVRPPWTSGQGRCWLRPLVVPRLTPLAVRQRASAAVPGHTTEVFAFFSSRIGCLGSLLISVILTALLWLVFAR